MAEACQQKWYYDWKIDTVNLKPGNLVLVKADTFKGKRKIKDRWEEDTWKVVCQITAGVPSYKVTEQHGRSCILHWNHLLLIASEVGLSLCVGICHAWDRCTSPTSCKPTSMEGEVGMTLQESSGSALTQCPTSKASLGWMNGKLWLLLWTSTGASTEDGWRPQVTWHGHKWQKDHVAFGWGNDIITCKYHQIVDLKTDVTTHGTGSWLARPNFGGVMGKYPPCQEEGWAYVYLPDAEYSHPYEERPLLPIEG